MTQREWRLEDCAVEPSSVVDPVGRVFRRDGRVYRAISAPHGAFVRDLVARSEARGWLADGLVPTTVTDIRIEGFEAVVEHDLIPFVSLRGEWSGEGLRSAALCILRLQASLMRDGLCLKDAHPWNVLFDGTTPRFVDWGSIRPASELHWAEFWYPQFRQFLLAPLYLFSTGRPRIARAMLREHIVGVGNELLELPALKQIPRVPAGIARSTESRPVAEAVEALADYVRQIELPDVPGEWEQYPQPAFESLENLESLRLKDRRVHQLLEHDPGTTLFDIGTNHGLHARIAVALGKTVVAGDIEETCLNRLFLAARAAKANLLPVYHDFLWPIGESGLLNSIPSSSVRLRCDTVLAMAVTHHLALKRNVSLEAIARGLHAQCHRRAIVEFVPVEDVHVAGWSEQFPAWYRLDAFVAELGKYFADISVVPSEPAPRVIIVCEGARPH